MTKEEIEADRIIKLHFDELESSFYEETDVYLTHIAKSQALLHVQGIIEALNNVKTDFPISIEIKVMYWNQVKQIIKNK